MGTPVDASTASKCVTGIYTSNYNVTFYDMDENNNIDMEEYAVKLTDQSVTALSLISTITSTLSTSSMTINIMSPSPTVFCIGCDNSKLLYYYQSLFISYYSKDCQKRSPNYYK